MQKSAMKTIALAQAKGMNARMYLHPIQCYLYVGRLILLSPADWLLADSRQFCVRLAFIFLNINQKATE